MKQKTIFITGSSSGIGRATVELFSKNGWNVAATMRSPEKESKLTKLPDVKLYKLDVLDITSINEAVSNVINDFGRIDVLVNNAGYGAIGPFEAATYDQIRHQFNTNVLGLFDVTREIIPHFRENQSGIIINISSVGGRLTFPLFSLYHGTKWAVEGFSESLHYELRPFGIKIKLIEPGAIKTDFYGRSQVIFNKEGLHDYDRYTEKVLPNMFKAGERGSSAGLVADAIY
ncbi:MAG: SDR family oxidoreductase, partial [Candidatus Moranbacteria bacterium]|nr:SDR family oxidoreductase [Candidatus Moranbacteria bacterium]